MLVVDASALADALMEDSPLGENARAVLSADPVWAAPRHVLIEVMSAVRRKALAGLLTDLRAAEIVEVLPDLVIDDVEMVEVAERTWQLRANVSAYDAAYVAAAELLECPLVTTDRRLARAPGVRCAVHVVTGT